jgi:tryptophan-rich sensory protein
VMALGYLWYGPLFGKVWSRATGVAMQGGAPDTGKMIATAVYLLVFNVGVAYTPIFDDIEHALAWGLIIGVLIVSGLSYAAVVWENRSTTAWMINAGYAWLAVAVSIYVQGLFL